MRSGGSAQPGAPAAGEGVVVFAASCCFVAGAAPRGALERPGPLEGVEGSGRAAPVWPRVCNKGKTLKIPV